MGLERIIPDDCPPPGGTCPAGFFPSIDAAEAARRIDDWFRRGYVMFSDRVTKSTGLRRVAP